MNLIEDVKRLRALLDEWYDQTSPHNKISSDYFLEANDLTNQILGEAMDVCLRLKEESL